MSPWDTLLFNNIKLLSFIFKVSGDVQNERDVGLINILFYIKIIKVFFKF